MLAQRWSESLIARVISSFVVQACAFVFVSMVCSSQAAAQATAEVPALASLVVQEKLPPLAARVGKDPLVVTPHEKVGRHGGVLRTALRGGGDHNAILRVVGPQGLVRWDAELRNIVPNVAKSWKVDNNATLFTFQLRRGMRWSDGRTFGADDVVFSMNDLVLNREFNPTVPGRYVAGGQSVKVEKIDEHTVQFRFVAPYRRFLQELATPLGQHATLYQRAYCGSFHPRYANKAVLAAAIKQGNHKDWSALLRQQCGDIEIPARWSSSARPTLDPWIIVEPYRGGATRVSMRRNPYFWQIDSAGQQLPYIDELHFLIISDIETILLKTLSSELDLQLRHINLLANKPVLAKNRKKANFEFVDLELTFASLVGVYLNLSHKDPTLRALFNNRDFRIALSHAIDREEILESVFLGVGEPYQVGPSAKHALHNKQLSTQFTTFDIKKANTLLDQIGLQRRDKAHFRLHPDGSRVFFTIDYPVNNPEAGDVLNLIRRDLKAVGIDIGINAVERSLFYDRAAKNDHDAAASLVPGGLDPEEDLRAIVAEHPLDSRQSLEWQKWYESKGKLGQVPNQSMQKRFDILDRWRKASTQLEADTLFRELLQEAADAFEVIGTVRSFSRPGVRRSNLRNVPSPMIDTWTSATPAAALPQQFFYD